MDQRQNNAAMNMKSDYVGGRWINDEFYFESKVQKDVQTKEDAIYGVFSEGFTPRAAGRKRTQRDYGDGVSFVSSGKILGGDKKEEKEPVSNITPAKNPGRIGEAEEPPDVASKFAAKTQQRKQQVKRKRTDRDFGKFEKHTKGFGAKMLAKWGIKKGQGLGKSGQGRVNPITVDTERGKSDGLGFGKRSVPKAAREEEYVEDTEDAEKARRDKRAKLKKEHESNWRRSLKPTQKIYKDAQSLLSNSTEAAASKPQVVIDMRGPNVRMTSLDKLNELDDDDEEADTSNIPELQHNLRLVVEMTESEIIKVNREKEHHEDTMFPLADERDKLEGVLKIQRETMSKLEQVQRHITACEQKIQELTTNRSAINERMNVVAALVELLQSKYPALYRDFELVNLAISLGFPLVELLLFNWEPLHDSPTQSTQWVLGILAHWKIMLSDEHTRGHKLDVWGQLLEEKFLPKLHRCINQQWRARQYDPMITLLKSLKPLLPSQYNILIAQSVVPKMTHALDTWNPRTDMTPVHTWIHPWIGTIPEELMDVLYQRIRYKLSIVLQHWQPHDSSALTVIKPWQTAWREADFEDFLGRNILQKLQLCLRTKFAVNPLNQDRQPFQWVMAWADTFPTRMMVHLLERDFFPKWFQALFDWLGRDPDFDEVSGWYMGWKNLFPPDLQKHPRLKQMFNSALDLMNEVVSGGALQTVYNRIVQDLHRPTVTLGVPRVLQQRQQQQQPKAPRRKQRVVELSFKETIERLASMHSISFAPSVGRSVDGKQVYEFARLSIYLERQNIYVLERPSKGSHRGSRWRPISLPDLLALAKM